LKAEEPTWMRFVRAVQRVVHEAVSLVTMTRAVPALQTDLGDADNHDEAALNVAEDDLVVQGLAVGVLDEAGRQAGPANGRSREVRLKERSVAPFDLQLAREIGGLRQ
jgi:hypothetical protein